MRISPEFLRFAAVGTANTLLDAGLFGLLHSGGIAIAPANVISSGCGLLLSLALNSRYTFRVQRVTIRQASVFIAINLVGLWVLQPIIIALLLMAARSLPLPESLLQQIGSDSFATSFMASMVATGGTFLWNYYMYRRFVYQDRDPT